MIDMIMDAIGWRAWMLAVVPFIGGSIAVVVFVMACCWLETRMLRVREHNRLVRFLGGGEDAEKWAKAYDAYMRKNGYKLGGE